MKKGLPAFAAPVTVAMILGLAVYAVPATGTSNSLATRVGKLEAANTKLAAANRKLTKRIANLETFAACNNAAAGISAAGDPATGTGYEFTPDNQVTVVLTNALVPTPDGATPDAFVQLVDPTCITGTPGALRTRGLTRLG